jgi:hypothetical protein
MEMNLLIPNSINMDNNMQDFVNEKVRSNIDTIKEFVLLAVFISIIIFSAWVFLN